MELKRTKRKAPINPATILLVKQLLFGLALFAVIGLVLTSVWYLSRLDTFTIAKVEVSGGKTIDGVLVQKTVEGVLEGTYLGLIPRRFSYFYPEANVLQAVENLDRIKDVSITQSDNKTLKVAYGEYVPDALWCNTEAKEANCLFLDETGYAFGLAPNLTGGSFTRYYSLGNSPAKDVRPFSEEDYKATRVFANLLAETGWYVDTIEIDAVRDVFFTLASGGEIKATLIEDINKTFSYLGTIRQSEEFSHLIPGGFQYIDLRFGTKVFVNEEKLIDPLLEATSTEAVSTTTDPQ
jgi:hypothetical protein